MKVYAENRLYKELTVSVMGKQNKLPVSDIDDHLVGVMFVYDNEAKAKEEVGDVKVTKPAVEPRKTFEEIVNKPICPDMPKLEPVIVSDEPVEMPDDLLEQAKNFAWNTNSDSLREFLAWLKR